MHHKTRSLWMLLVFASVVTLSASPPVIGVAQSRGAFLINNASVPGSATIFNGSSLKTLDLSSDVHLKSGENLTLGSASAATIYQDRLVLESGLAELHHLARYTVEADNLHIAASGSEAHVRVSVDGSRQVRVAALDGAAEVRTARGVLVARVFPGTALQLQVGSGNTSLLTGVLKTKSGKFFLTDETTKVNVELRGSGLDSLVGKRVQVTGSVAADQALAPGVAQVIAVTQITAVSAAAAGAGAAATGAAVSSGISTTAIAAIGSTVAAGGTVGGLAAAGTFSASGTTVSR